MSSEEHGRTDSSGQTAWLSLRREPESKLQKERSLLIAPESEVLQWEHAAKFSDSQLDREEDGEQDVWPQYPL